MKKLLSMPAANHEGTSKIAQRIFEEHLKNSKHFTVFLQGSLGAGKTFIVKEILKHFGITEEITSPTYALAQEYDRFAHFDFYRLESPQEFYDRGFTEIAEDSSTSCFVEWGDKIDSTAQSLFGGDKYIIRIEHGIGVGMRKITLYQKA